MKISTNVTLPKAINFKDLLKNINQEEAFSWFLGTNTNSKFRNPFRNDKVGKCYLEYRQDGLLLMWDWGDVRFKGKSIIQVIQQVKGLSYLKAALYLRDNFRRNNNEITKVSKITTKGSFDKIIFPTSRKWIKEDKEYWDSYYINLANLEFEKVMGVAWYYTNSKNKPQEFVSYKPKHPTYAIPIQTRWKIYTPEIKFFDTNQKWDDIGGLQPFNDDEYIIVTKSYKDYQVLVNQGYNSRYILCETVTINPKFVKYISKEFKKVYYLMDNDMPGVKACERLVNESKAHTGLDIYHGIYFPTHLPKDSSDFIKEFGETQFNYQIEELLQI